MIYNLIKRIFDFLLALFTVVVLLPLFIIVVIILNFTAEREVFFFQKRMGLNNKLFKMLKFATMLKNSWEIGSKSITTRDDPRVTKFGKLLRRTKINELPQIINVLLGDMSIVGPRPLPNSSFMKYSENVQNKIYKNKPGITGLGSLVFRDEEKIISLVTKYNSDPMEFYKHYIYPYKGLLEIYYFNNKSFSLDLKIIFSTAIKIIFSEFSIEQKMFKNLPIKPSILDPVFLKKKLHNEK